MYKIHNYDPARPEELPQDPDMDGSSLTYIPLEHGGPPVEGGGFFPHAIRVTDEEGRSHVYQCTTVGGGPVHCRGYVFSSRVGDYARPDRSRDEERGDEG